MSESSEGAGYTVADYLLDRLAELGVTEIFGVPGDFNLEFLDHVLAHHTIRWVGTANELNAGYAADGYGRLRGIAALATTHGVGELSAANAIAGSYAEHVPVVHVVGAPSLDAQSSRRVMHHSLGDGDFEHFLRMSREITCAQANLTPATATREIDRVLTEVRERRQPGYLMVPTDVARFPAAPAVAPLRPQPSNSSPRAVEAFIDAATSLIGDHHVTVLADLLVHRVDAVAELRRLLAADDVPHATLMWGKSLVDENSSNFIGLYAGAMSSPGVRNAIEDAPVLVTAGVQFTDLVTGFFSHRIDAERTIDIGVEQSIVAGTLCAPIDMKTALDALTTIVQTRARTPALRAAIPPEPPALPVADSSGALSQDQLWEAVSRALRPGSIVLADQGTSFYGMAAHRLPSGTTFIGQPLWASIGYTLPATLGAALARPDGRPVLLIGDGAAQLTVQELGTLARENVSAIVVVVNNGGYAIERAIRGAEASYNDIVAWNWSTLPAALGVPEAITCAAHTADQLDEALRQAALHRDRLVLIEAVTAPLDLPSTLTQLARAAREATRPIPWANGRELSTHVGPAQPRHLRGH